LLEIVAGAFQHGFRAAHIVDLFAREFRARQWIQVGGVGVVPAEIELIDRLGIVAQRAVIAARGPVARETRRQPQALGDLRRRQAVIEQPHALIVDEFIEVALLLEKGDGARIAPHRPVVLRDHDFGLVAVALDGVGNVARPQAAIADLRAADGVEIVHGVIGVFRHVEHPELRKVHQHFRRRLGARHEMEFDLDAVDAARLVSLGDHLVRRDQRDRAKR
jgi:hypothetical protein